MRHFTLLGLAIAGALSLGLGCYEEGDGSGGGSGSDEGPAASETIYSTCVSDAQCDPSETCLDNVNVCTTECEEDRDCPQTESRAQICLAQQCVIGCLSGDDHCPEGQVCADSGPSPYFCRPL